MIVIQVLLRMEDIAAFGEIGSPQRIVALNLGAPGPNHLELAATVMNTSTAHLMVRCVTKY